MIFMFIININKVTSNKKYMHQTAAKYSKTLNNYFKPWQCIQPRLHAEYGSFRHVDVLCGLGTTLYNQLPCGAVNTISGNLLDSKFSKKFLLSANHGGTSRDSLQPPSVYGNLVGNFLGVRLPNSADQHTTPHQSTAPSPPLYQILVDPSLIILVLKFQTQKVKHFTHF